MIRLSIIATHPVQYYAPWFRNIASQPNLTLKVFYLLDTRKEKPIDPGFQKPIEWDIPLLDGYDYEFVDNVSSNPRSSSFWGLQNPTLNEQVMKFEPSIVLMMCYNYYTCYKFIMSWRKSPIIFRGDSHRLIEEHSVKSRLKRVIISFIFSKFHACLYVGKANYYYYIFNGVDPSKLYFSPYAVDNDRFCSQEVTALAKAMRWKIDLGIPANHAVILFSGKFINTKRPLDLLHAYKMAKLTDVSLLFVGNGELENELIEQSKDTNFVFIAPFQNQSLMPRTYSVADIFVLPSHGETWGLSVNEAMCMCKPIIVSDHVGCAADLVIPYVNGFIFPAGNILALRDSLIKAFAERDILLRWGQASRRIINQYNYSHATQGLMDAINAVSPPTPRST